MERMTRLRAIRLKYGISLVELERHSRVSNQYLSALELGNVSRTANNEEVLGCAIDEIIRSRKSSLLGLEQMIVKVDRFPTYFIPIHNANVLGPLFAFAINFNVSIRQCFYSIFWHFIIGGST